MEIEGLISGGSIKKEIHQELTYKDLDADINYLWSILFYNGYFDTNAKMMIRN